MRYLLLLLSLIVGSIATIDAKKNHNKPDLGVAESTIATNENSETKNVTSLFLSAPDELMPALPYATRLDMLDYFNYGSNRAIQNIFGGESRILSINESDMTVQAPDVHTYQIILLKKGKENIIAVITTLLTPTADSHIDFYDMQWQKTDNKLFEAPTLKNWLTSEGQKHLADIENALPFTLVSYSYDPQNSILTLTNNSCQTLSAEDNEKLSQYFIPSISYKWNGKKMNKLK